VKNFGPRWIRCLENGIVDPEGEFIPGETTIKQYYCKRFDGYVTVPGASLFKVAPDGCKLEARLTQSRLCVD
jgi:hypothetical protein